MTKQKTKEVQEAWEKYDCKTVVRAIGGILCIALGIKLGRRIANATDDKLLGALAGFSIANTMVVFAEKAAEDIDKGVMEGYEDDDHASEAPYKVEHQSSEDSYKIYKDNPYTSM